MKKSFTLIEVVISITLFSIVLIFMYKTLDMTNFTNNIFEKKVKANKKINDFKDIIIEDILESSEVTNDILLNDFYILKIKTTNMFHNDFYKYVYYLVSKENKLYRLESMDTIDFQNFSLNSIKNVYVDLLIDNVEKFDKAEFRQVYKNNLAVTILFKQKNKNHFFINSIQMIGKTDEKK